MPKERVKRTREHSQRCSQGRYTLVRASLDTEPAVYKRMCANRNHVRKGEGSAYSEEPIDNKCHD